MTNISLQEPDNTDEPHILFKQTRHPDAVDEAFHTFNRSNCLNAVYWNHFFQSVEGIPFDSIVECGVGRGRSLITIASLESLYAAANKRARRTVFALDSFEGFPEPSVYDQSNRNPKKGEWSTSSSGKYKYSPEFLRQVLINADLGSDISNIVLIKGFFDESIPTIAPGSIGLLHLDGDLYHSVLDPLAMLWMNVVRGGIVVIDDYLIDDKNRECESFPGARKAVEMFLSSNDYFEMKKSIRGTPYLLRVK